MKGSAQIPRLRGSAGLRRREFNAQYRGMSEKEIVMRNRRLMGTVSLLALSAACVLIAAPAADARVTKIQIASKQSPTFGGYVFKDVGAYEKIVGKAYGELDPKDPKNAIIVDIQLAPKNAKGM